MAVPAQSQPAPAESPAAQQAAPDASGRTGANAPTTGPGPTPPSNPSEQEQVSRGPDYFRQAFSRVRSYRQSTQTDPAPQAPPVSADRGPETERSGASPAPERKPEAPNATPASTLPPRQQPGQSQPSSSDNAIVLTPEQLARRVQAEADRILTKHRADEAARQKEEEERQLRREDPIEYVRRLEAKEEEQRQTQSQLQQANKLLEDQLTLYDRGVLDTFVGALPEGIRKKVLTTVKTEGIPGRSEIAQHTLAALKHVWQAEIRETAKQSLMKDPSFIKEVLARYGGQIERPEPEAVSALPPSAGARPQTSHDMVNSWMREAASVARQTSGKSR
jgi:hypothetical protein